MSNNQTLINMKHDDTVSVNLSNTPEIFPLWCLQLLHAKCLYFWSTFSSIWRSNLCASYTNVKNGFSYLLNRL